MLTYLQVSFSLVLAKHFWEKETEHVQNNSSLPSLRSFALSVCVCAWYVWYIHEGVLVHLHVQVRARQQESFFIAVCLTPVRQDLSPNQKLVWPTSELLGSTLPQHPMVRLQACTHATDMQTVSLFTWTLGFKSGPHVCAAKPTEASPQSAARHLFMASVKHAQKCLYSLFCFVYFELYLLVSKVVPSNSISLETEANRSLRPAWFLVSQGYTMRHCLKQKQNHTNIPLWCVGRNECVKVRGISSLLPTSHRSQGSNQGHQAWW